MTISFKLSVNKKTITTTFILASLFLVAAGTQFVSLAGANPNMFKKGRYCNISIQSPQKGTYNAEPVFLNFSVKKVDVSDTYSYFYLLDGQDIQSGVKVEEIQLVGQETITNDTFFPYTEVTLKGQAVLPNLSDGSHNLTVFIGWVREDEVIFHANIDPFSTTAYFSVDTTTPTSSPLPSPQETETEPEPFTVALGTTAALAVVVIGVSLLVYFKKRNHKG
jgi:hypothetical protein